MCSGTSNYKYNIKYSSVLIQHTAIICNLLFQIFNCKYFLKSVNYGIFAKRNYIRFLEGDALCASSLSYLFISLLPNNISSTTCVLTVRLNCAFTQCVYTVRLHCAFTLYVYTVRLHCAFKLCVYTVRLHCETLCVYTVRLHCALTLCVYTVRSLRTLILVC